MKKQLGFTLIEVMIVVVIVGILFAVGVPSYRAFVVKSKRSEAVAALTSIAGEQLQFFSENNRYAADLTQLGYPDATLSSESGVYTISTLSATVSDFTLTATANADQAGSDSECGNFTLNHMGVKGVTGSGTANDCW